MPKQRISAADQTHVIDERIARALGSLQITTVGELAQHDATRLNEALPFMVGVELRAKARLALRTASELMAVPALRDRTVWDILSAPKEMQAGDAPVQAVARLYEQCSILQVALNNKVLRQVTIGELTAGSRREP